MEDDSVVTDDNRDLLRRVCPDIDPSEWEVTDIEHFDDGEPCRTTYALELESGLWVVVRHHYIGPDCVRLTYSDGWYTQEGDADGEVTLADLAAGFRACSAHLNAFLRAEIKARES